MANDDNLNAQVGERVHQVMWRRRVTQTEMAAALGIDQAAVNRRLRGKTAWKLTEIVEVARLLDVRVGELIPDAPFTRDAAGAEFRCTRAFGQSRRLRIVRRDEVAGTRQMPIRHAS